jgi:hypothetical protein
MEVKIEIRSVSREIMINGGIIINVIRGDMAGIIRDIMTEIMDLIAEMTAEGIIQENIVAGMMAEEEIIRENITVVMTEEEGIIQGIMISAVILVSGKENTREKVAGQMAEIRGNADHPHRMCASIKTQASGQRALFDWRQRFLGRKNLRVKSAIKKLRVR